jgi:hypothetical protein
MTFFFLVKELGGYRADVVTLRMCGLRVYRQLSYGRPSVCQVW